MSVEEPNEVNEEVKEPKLTREQRRQLDRANQEAHRTFILLAEKFRTCFMENDPEGEAVATKRKEVNAKWRVFCKNNEVVEEAYAQIATYCDSLVASYQAELNPPEDANRLS